jgi:hypothetical protein
MSCSVEWGFATFFESYFVNHMVQEGPFVEKFLALQAGPFAGESIAKHDVLL